MLVQLNNYVNAQFLYKNVPIGPMVILWICGLQVAGLNPVEEGQGYEHFGEMAHKTG